MQPQFEALSPVLHVLSKQIKILPATGGAVEVLERPDEEELEDILINRESKTITEFAETPIPSAASIYRPTPPLFRAEKHLYRFFIDGSLRTYYLATGLEGGRSFPIELAQIGAAVMQRDDSGNIRSLAIKHRILLLLPKGPLGVSDTVWAELEKLNTPNSMLQIINTAERNVNTPQEPSIENLRTRAGGVARNRMHKLEIEIINVTDGRRDQDHRLILDGAVKLDEFINTPSMIGVAKNYRKDLMFYFGKRTGRKDVTQILAGLPYAYRTVAFSSHDRKVAFWYVRLRRQEEVDYPLMGVVKVELPRPDRTPVESEEVDLISRTLVAERNVTPHGSDQRWHCHLYPIFQAEQAIKTRFYSQQVLMGMIHWPSRYGSAIYFQEVLL